MDELQVCRQESFKEKAVSSEILFAGAQNQLLVLTNISFNCGVIKMKEYIFSIKLADFLLNTYAPSRLGERIFKRISFHT